MTDHEIVEAALRIADDSERGRFLESICGTDSQRRRRLAAEISQALAGLGQTGVAPPGPMTSTPGLTSVISADSGPPPPAHRLPAPGQQIGPYKLVQLLGEGGMGSVWMASQREPVQRMVALKCVKPGLSSDRVLGRFEIERQALALMDHPNIAKVLDAGESETGQPYFVMELVKGIPVTKYCDERRLNIRQRLEIFIPICQAVQHAHMKGIIHRDLKPSNVMVTEYDGRPVPKVIDFGVAKALGTRLTERSVHTEFGSVIGTLEYMAPEQAELNALDVDTRSDIYSLGVLLYELLTGSTPLGRQTLQQMAFAEVIRQIKEVEPPKPSTRLSNSKESLPTISAQRHIEPARLPEQVRGELDWIVMKSLAKERERRYDSANGFAQDIERFLTDQPVVARAPSTAYFVSKFIRRHRVGVASVAAMTLFLIGASVVSAYFGIEARKARDAARLERDKAITANAESKATLRYFEDIIMSAVRPVEYGGLGRLATVHEALDAGEPQIAKAFSDKPLAAASARQVLGMSYYFLGEYAKAVKQLQMAYDVQKASDVLGPEHDVTLRSQLSLAAALAGQKNYAAAIPICEEVVRLRKNAFGSDHETTRIAMNNLADNYRAAGRPENALAIFDDLLKLESLASQPKSSLTLSVRCNRGLVLRAMKRFDEAAAEQEAVLDVRRQTLAADNTELLNSLGYVADLMAKRGKLDEAIARWEELVALRTKKSGPTHPDTINAMHWLADTRLKRGLALVEQKQPAIAEPMLLAAYRGFDGLGDPVSPATRHKGRLAAAEKLATIYADAGNGVEADKWMTLAAELRKSAP